MARRRRKRRGLGYGCPCVQKSRSGTVCATVPIKKGSRKYKTVCRSSAGKLRQAVLAATRPSRGKRLNRRRATQLKNFRTRARRRLRG
jgi:hypothetical protein